MYNCSQITTAKIHFNEQGNPVADDFDDVYFSNHDGLAETRYVFLAGNNIPQCWHNFDSTVFTVAETGFGSGMNFLALWQEFTQVSPSCKLHFISFEKHPMTVEQLEKCLALFPSLSEFATQLIDQYPAPNAGLHNLEFLKGKITLSLYFGDVNDLIPTINLHENQQVNAWFLDGFAPSKNPQMWTQNLFENIFRLTAPNGSIATFTAAGFVRRGLNDAGFNVQKIKGYGSKRNMTIANKAAQ